MIARVEIGKDLGVYIDESLTFKTRIDHLSKRRARFCCLFFVCVVFFLISGFYNVYLKPIIQYGILFFDSTIKPSVDKIHL